ncbi:MAG: hypothetical protein DRN29_09495 [Thermoplasmata archaeon]|nr:MAG: hypothetical protein DRN29_09495 [Thermoplasmata archaeon]
MEQVIPKNRPDGITLLSILFWILAIFAIIGGLFMIGAKNAIIDMMKEQPNVSHSLINLMNSAMIFIGAIALLIGILYAIAGLGLWKLKPWARIIAIILAIISLLNFPVGTAIGIIVLWYLFKAEIKEAFRVNQIQQ